LTTIETHLEELCKDVNDSPGEIKAGPQIRQSASAAPKNKKKPPSGVWVAWPDKTLILWKFDLCGAFNCSLEDDAVLPKTPGTQWITQGKGEKEYQTARVILDL
jgi:hypothetical protein